MTKEKKDNEKKIEMENRQNISVLTEVLYNCPYLILVVLTFVAVMICSDEIGIKAVAREARVTVQQTIGIGVLAEELPAEYVANEVEISENTDDNNLAEMENEGERKEEIDDIENEEEHKTDDETEESAENTEKIVRGITRFEFYEPLEIDSPYYSDAGKIALTTEYPYVKENVSYFNDAVFLGDSRTLGISDYAGLDETDFYCDSGMTIFKLLEEGGVTYQRTGNKEDVSLALQQKKYGKIYIMLGMNELGYGNTERYLEKYREVVNQIREWQPDSIIYIMANLHVSREKNNMETEFNNVNINDKNAASARLANGIDIFYLDVNPLFTDAEGFLNEDLSFDGVHLYAQHYDKWREFLLEHAVEAKEASQDESISEGDMTEPTEEQVSGDTES